MKFLLTNLLVFLLPFSAYAGGYSSYGGYYGNAVIVNKKVIELDADLALGYDGYIIAGKAAIEKSHARDDLDKENLNEALKALNKALDRLGVSTPTPESGQVIGTVETPPAIADNSTELDKKALAIFFQKCGSCHTSEKRSGGVELFSTFTEGGQELAKLFLVEDECKELARRANIVDVVEGLNLADRGKKLMPLNSDPLSDEEVQTLKLWMYEQVDKIK